MAILHDASVTPTKLEAVASWLPKQPWAPPGEIEKVTAFRFDDPEGEVGVEVLLVRVGGVLLQVPLTYRAQPMDGGVLVTEMEHTALGHRWVYDGCSDPVCLRMMCGAALTGVGQAAGVLKWEGRWVMLAPQAIVHGGGWTGGALPLDDFSAPVDDGAWTIVRSPEVEVRIARCPEPGSSPLGLTATWAGQDTPVLLAAVTVDDSAREVAGG